MVLVLEELRFRCICRRGAAIADSVQTTVKAQQRTAGGVAARLWCCRREPGAVCAVDGSGSISWRRDVALPARPLLRMWTLWRGLSVACAQHPYPCQATRVLKSDDDLPFGLHLLSTSTRQKQIKTAKTAPNISHGLVAHTEWETGPSPDIPHPIPLWAACLLAMVIRTKSHLGHVDDAAG